MSADPTQVHETLLEAFAAARETTTSQPRVRPQRRKSKVIVQTLSVWCTARLYACGHEITTIDNHEQPADACPKCGAEKNAKYGDNRHRRSLPAEPA